MTSKNKKSLTAGSFPFFGAGFANYFEWADLSLRFKQAPDKTQVQQISAAAPAPLKAGEAIGRMMTFGSEQFVNMYIEEAYATGEGAEASGDPSFYVSVEAANAFEDDIERWLKEVHRICPIEFVFRAEDEEADGIEFSSWHEESLLQVPALIQDWEQDPYTYTQLPEEKELFESAVGGIFDYAQLETHKVSRKFLDTFFPDIEEHVPVKEDLPDVDDMTLEHLLDTDAIDEAVAYLRNHSSTYNSRLIAKEFKDWVYDHQFDKANAFADFVSDESKEAHYVWAAADYNGINFEKALEINLRGIEACPASQLLIANGIWFAHKAGKPDVAARFAYYPATSPLLIANQSFHFLETDKSRDAYDLLTRHYTAGVVLDTSSLANLWYVYQRYEDHDVSLIPRMTEETKQRIDTAPDYYTTELLGNMMSYLGKRDPLQTIEIFDHWIAKNRFAPCRCWVNYSNAAIHSKDNLLMQRVFQDVETALAENNETFCEDHRYWMLVGNLAGLAGLLHNKDMMLKYLTQAKPIYPDFARLKEDTDFKRYWEDADFLALFKE